MQSIATSPSASRSGPQVRSPPPQASAKSLLANSRRKSGGAAPAGATETDTVSLQAAVCARPPPSPSPSLSHTDSTADDHDSATILAFNVHAAAAPPVSAHSLRAGNRNMFAAALLDRAHRNSIQAAELLDSAPHTHADAVAIANED